MADSATDPSTDPRRDVPGEVPPLRLAPVKPDEQDEATRELLAVMPSGPDGQPLNLFSTLAHHPRLLKRWAAFGGVLLQRGELPGRDRELLILRTAWNCRARYEWEHHDEIARALGMDTDEIARVAAGPDAEGWSDHDALLLRAADELHTDARLSEPTWEALAERYSEAELIEVCMVVGQYHMVAFTLNSLGVQLEPAQ